MSRKTGPSTKQASIVLERSKERCELHLPGCAGRGEQIHHRRPRGAGGTSRADTNWPSNLMHLCHGCHAYVESHRVDALEYGWLVRQYHDPQAIPVRIWGTSHYLTPDGHYLLAEDKEVS